MTAQELIDAANNARSVSGFHTHNFKPMPAAFIVSMHFRDVMRVLPRLQLYTAQQNKLSKRHITNE